MGGEGNMTSRQHRVRSECVVTGTVIDDVGEETEIAERVRPLVAVSTGTHAWYVQLLRGAAQRQRRG